MADLIVLPCIGSQDQITLKPSLFIFLINGGKYFFTLLKPYLVIKIILPNLNFNIIDNGNDIQDFDIQYIENDGIHFSEWKYWGTFNQSIVKFEGSDDTKYRFRSISKDIYGNIETKEGYDYEVNIDTTVPTTNFKNLEQNYYFTSLTSVLLSWESNDDDIQLYTVTIKYTNFTDEYLDPDTVVWDLLDTINSYNSEPFVYQLNNTGHYQFKIIATDKAGNIEEKEEPDFILNYDSRSDDLQFIDVPKKWGYDEIEIEFYSPETINCDFFS